MKMKNIGKLLSLFLIAAVLATSLFAIVGSKKGIAVAEETFPIFNADTDIYVSSASGNDVNDGKSMASSKQTLANAIEKKGVGGEIFILDYTFETTETVKPTSDILILVFDSSIVNATLPVGTLKIESGATQNVELYSYDYCIYTSKITEGAETKTVTKKMVIQPDSSLADTQYIEITIEKSIQNNILYELNGGNSDDNAILNYIEGVGTENFVNPTKLGFSFDGFYATIDFSGDKITSITKEQTGDVTLYANWIPNEILFGNKSFSTTVGTSFTNALSASVDGSTITSFELTEGTLPIGLTLSKEGVISGTPTTATSTPITVTVTVTAENGAVATGTLSFTVKKGTPIVIPNVPIGELTYGDKLPNLTATATVGGVTIEGAISFDVGQTLLAGNKNYTWTYFPTNTLDYENANGVIHLSVKKAIIDMSAVKFDNVSFVYDNTIKKLEVSGLPSNVDVAYTSTINAGSGKVSQNEMRTWGVLSITATFTPKENDNHELSKTSINADLIIKQREVAITINHINAIYSKVEIAVPQNGYTITSGSILNGDKLTITKDNGINVGKYNLVGTFSDNDNYSIKITNGICTIARLGVTVTIDNKTVTYGDVDVPLTEKTDGLIGDDSLKLTLRRQTGKDVGVYAIYVTNGNGNYNPTFNNASYTITKKAATVTLDDKTSIYRDPIVALTYSVTGLIEGDTLNQITVLPKVSIGTTFGNYAITAHYVSKNYNVTVVEGKYVVTKRTATIIINDITSVYGDPIKKLEYTVENAAQGDVIVVVLTKADGTIVGTYNITATATNSNYDFIYKRNNTSSGETAAKYTITARPVVVTIDKISIVYGDSEKPLTFKTSNVMAGENLGVSLTRTAGTDAATYNIIGSYTNKNYAVTFTNETGDATYGQYVIKTRIARFVAKNIFAFYGDSKKALEYEIHGLIPSDIGKYTATLSCDVNPLIVGTYTISVTGLPTNGNYVFSQSEGYYTVSKKQISVTVFDQMKIYGDDTLNPTSNLADKLIKGDTLTLKYSLDTVKNVGDYQIAQPTYESASYEITFNMGKYKVIPRRIIITINDINAIYGEDISTPNFTVNNLASGELADILNLTYYDLALKGHSVGTVPFSATINNANYSAAINYANCIISAKSINVSIENKTSIYGNPLATLTAITDSGVDITSLLLTFTMNEKNVGIYEITALSANKNYAIAFTNGKYDITKRNINVKIDSFSAIYGEAKKLLTADLSEVLEGDDINCLLQIINESNNVGRYVIEGAYQNDNYNVNFTNGQYAITPKSITVKVHENGISGEYGEPIKPFIATVDGVLAYSDTLEDLLLDIKKQVGITVGVYDIIASTTCTNYTISFVCGKYLITPRTITVTIGDATSQYRDMIAESSHTVTVGSIVDGDNLGIHITYPTRGTSVGSYPITATISNPNYNATIVNGTYTVVAKDVAVLLDNKTSIYGNAFVEMTAQTADVDIDIDELKLKFAKAEGLNVGNYVISAISQNENYNVTFTDGNYEITKRSIIITADDKKVVYGEEQPILTANTSQILPNDTINIRYILESTTDPRYAVGTYTIKLELDAASASINNYEITLADGKYIVTKRGITVTIDPISAIYGEIDTALTYTVDNAIEDDDLSIVLTRKVGIIVGEYAISGSSTNGNYKMTFVGATYTITPRPVTVTIDDKTAQYGDPLAKLTCNITNLASGELLEILLKKADGANVGNYVISGICKNGNYIATFTNGTYSITSRKISVKILNSTSVYGELLANIKADLSEVLSINGVKDDLLLNLIKADGDIVGKYDITANYNNANYEVAFVNEAGEQSPATYEITKKNIKVSVGGLKIPYGEAKKSPTADISGFLESDLSKIDFLYTIDGYTDNVGKYIISLIITDKGESTALGNYEITIEKGEYEITAREITVRFLGYQGLVYSGKIHEIKIEFDNIANGETILGNIAYSATPQNAGLYTATVTVSDTNYILVGEKELNFEIAKATYDMSNFVFDEKSYVYNGQLKVLNWSGTLPNGVTVDNISPNEMTNVGSLDVTITFLTEDEANYNTVAAITKQLNITKATYDMSGFVFNSKSYIYDGKTHELTYSGLPTGVSILSLTGNSLKNKGVSNVKISFNIADKENYFEVDSREAKLEITAKELIVRWGASKFTYSGQLQQPTATVDTGIVGENIVLKIVITSNTDCISAITHNVMAVMKDQNDNYTLAGDRESYTISKLSVTVSIPTFSGKLTYGDPLPQLTSTTVGGYVELVKGQILTAGVKDYEWTFVVTDNINYIFSGVKGKIKLTVDKFNVTVENPIYSGGVLTFGDLLPQIITTTTGGKICIKEGQLLKVGTFDYEWIFIPDDSDNYQYFNTTGTITLSVEPKRFGIVFHTGGGTEIPSISGIIMDTLLENIPSNPTRPGYKFISWYQDKSFTMPFDLTTMLVISNMDLYAKWELLPVSPEMNAKKAGFNKILLTITFEHIEGLNYTVQWYKSIDGKDTKIEGATGYSLPLYGYEDSGIYACYVDVSDEETTVGISITDSEGINIGTKPIPALAWVFTILILIGGIATFVLLAAKYSKDKSTTTNEDEALVENRDADNDSAVDNDECSEDKNNADIDKNE